MLSAKMREHGTQDKCLDIVNAKSYHASGFDNWLGVRSSRLSKKRASVMDLVLGRAEQNDYQTIPWLRARVPPVV